MELTGCLSTPDETGRLRLVLVDRLKALAGPDNTWIRLLAAAPAASGSVPYRFDHQAGQPDDAGIRGECWVRLPGGARGQRMAAYAKELQGKEVRLWVTAKRYRYLDPRRGPMAGTALVYANGLEALDN